MPEETNKNYHNWKVFQQEMYFASVKELTKTEEYQKLQDEVKMLRGVLTKDTEKYVEILIDKLIEAVMEQVSFEYNFAMTDFAKYLGCNHILLAQISARTK